jgi:serine/threonine protein kinase
MQSLPNGTTLGEYTLIRLIGRGGMGEVYEAYEAKLHRRVALKLIAPLQPDEHDYEDLFRRFLQEARTLAQVNHPNIVTIYDIDRVSGAQFIAMEYVNGLSLKQLLKEISFSLEEVIPVFAQILDGLTCLHDNHILHRDLKPHNILLRVDGQIKILDFGIAKQITPGQGEGTQLGVIAGTLPYMAPEIKIGDPATTSSDIYSLGAIFYELLVGRALARVMLDHPNTTEIPWSREDQSRIPQGMRTIVNKMCANRLADRYQKATEVIEDLKRFRQSRPAVPPEVYDAMVKKVAEINELKRKEITSEYSFTSLKNNSPMATELRLNPERRKARRKSRKRANDYLAYGAAVGGVLIAVGTWFGFRSAKHQIPSPQPVISATDSGSRALQPPLVLMEPKDQSILWLEPSRIPTLSWSRPLGADEYNIQIAMDTRFNKIIISEPIINGTSFRPASVLPEGKYYWRLESKHGQAPVAGPFRFTIAHLKPVELVSPNAQRVFDAEEEFTEVEFAWKCKPGADTYRIQIAESQDFGSIAKEQVVKVCQYKTGRVPAGNYFWRVKMEGDQPVHTLWSEVRTFTVRESEAGPAPAPVSAPTQSRNFERSHPRSKKPLTNYTLKSPSTPVRLEWTPLRDARSYVVQMSLNKDFNSILAEESVPGAYLDWRNATPGRVFWRVRGIDKSGSPSEFSPRAMAVIYVPAPRIKNVFKFTKGQKDSMPMIDWDRTPGASKYLVKIGRSRNLASVDEQLVSDSKMAVREKPGQYYIRVAAATEAGDPISAFSDPSTVIIEGYTLDRPVTQSPGMGARAPSREGRLSAKFSWTAIPNAEVYSVELSADSDFSRIIQKLRTPGSVFFLKQAQLKGRVYWRVRAESSRGNSEWSAPSYFDVR